MSNQSLRQASVRAVTGTAYHYEGDWLALFDAQSVTAGTFNDRMRVWLNSQMGTSYQFLSDAMHAYAVFQGFTSWDEMGTFTPYDTAAASYFAAQSTRESVSFRSAVNTFISGLKTDSLWNILDGGNILACSTVANAFVDFKVPSRIATRAGSPTHTFAAGVGFTGSGAAAANQTDYIETGFIPFSANGNFVQDSAQISVYSRTSGQGAGADIGGVGTAASFRYRTRHTSDSVFGNANASGANVTLAASVLDGSGFFIVSRTGPTTTTTYRNGVAIGTSVTASTGNLDVPIRYLQMQSSGASTKQLSFGSYGGGLDATQAANLNTRVTTLLTALGAN